jgi:hypothetical protein
MVILARRNWRFNLIGYHTEHMEQAVRNVLKAQVRGGDSMTFREANEEPNRQICRVALVATKHANEELVKLFRSYPKVPFPSGNRESRSARSAQIWQAIRASTVAPTYFEPMEIHNHQYVDGGMSANNPSWKALLEAIGAYGEGIRGTSGSLSRLGPASSKLQVYNQKRLSRASFRS